MLVKEEGIGESALGFLEDSGLWVEDGDDSGDGISNSDVLEPAHAVADMSVYASSSSSNESSQEDITDALERYLDRLSSPTPISVSTESVSVRVSVILPAAMLLILFCVYDLEC
jgi:hypothetical protein